MRCWGVYDTNILAGLQRPALKQPLQEEMARNGFDLNDVEIKGHPIRWFSPQNRVVGARAVLLVGDAAGADPMFGEGMKILRWGTVRLLLARSAHLSPVMISPSPGISRVYCEAPLVILFSFAGPFHRSCTACAGPGF